MAYVGTPTRLGSARDTLASIIQGEAGGQGLRGMQAVAQVISNRAATNFSGYGRNLVSQAVAPRQFQGQNLSRISPQAYQVADQAIAGQLPNVVGGAVNYANPRTSTPGNWGSRLNAGNAYQLGAHFFTDNTRGVPFSPGDVSSSAPMNSNNPTAVSPSDGLGYSPPDGFKQPGIDTSAGSEITGFKSATGNANDATEVTLGFPGDDPSATGNGLGSGTGTGLGGTTQGLGGVDGAPITGSNFSQQSFAGTAGTTGGTPGFGLGGVQADGASVNTGAVGGFSGDPKGTPGSASVGSTSGQPFASQQGGGAGKGGSAGGDGDPVVGYNSAGPVIGAGTVTGAINQSGQKVSGSVDKGAKQIGDDTKEAGKTIGQSVTGLAGTLKGISDAWQALGKDYFIRLAFIVVGLIALAAALMMFKPVQNAVAAVVPAGRAIKAANKLKGALAS